MIEENSSASLEADKIEPSNGAPQQGQQHQPEDQTDDVVDREDDDGADGEANQEDGAGDEEEGKRRNRSRSERQSRKIARLEARIEELVSGRANPPVQDGGSIEEAVKARIGEAPKESDFSDYFDYRDAKAAYEADKRLVTRQITEANGRQQQVHAQRISAMADDYEDNLKEAAAAIPDLIDTLQKSKFVPTKVVELLILETGEKAPLVSYYLAQNERIAQKLNQMPERQALRELGRIEALVSRPKNKATNAPAPMNRPKGGASPSRSIGKSMSDYERWRNS